MWGMADAFSRSPANVRDGWCVPQKTADVRGQLILYFTYTNAHDYLSYLLTYLKLDICNMAHETNKATSDQSNTPRPAGGEGDQGSMTFFYRHFLFLGNQEQVFLFSLLISKLIHALYLNAHFNTTQGTKCRIFFTIIETWSHRLR